MNSSTMQYVRVRSSKYANRSGLPEAVLENLQEIEEDDEVFESIEELWPDYPSKEDFLFNEDEY